MEKEIYSLIDTTVKIGLGATISTVGAYFLSKSKHNLDIKKNHQDSTIKMLTEIAIKLEQAQHKFDEAHHPFWVQLVDGNHSKTHESTKICLSRHLEATSILRECKALASLLNLKEAALLLSEAESITGEIYEKIASNNPLLYAEEINKKMSSVTQKLSACLLCLSDAYNNHLI